MVFGRVRYLGKCITMLLLFYAKLTLAQQEPVNLEKYSFIRYEYNKINYAPDSLDFFTFFRKFDRLATTGQGKINVLHFGGSHVQADIWTGRIREHFNHFLGASVAARGILVPFSILPKSNNPRNYKVSWNGKWQGCRNAVANSCSYGLTGFNFTTTDSGASITLQLLSENGTRYKFNRVKVFHQFGMNCLPFGPDSTMKSVDTIINEKGGYTEFIFQEQLETFTLHTGKGDSIRQVFTLYGILCDLDAPGLNYHAIGVNGAKVPSYLRCDYLEQHVGVIQPDLVIFSVGINDAFDNNFSQSWYEENYKELITRIKRASPSTAILFTTNTDSYKKVGRRRVRNNTGPLVQESMQRMSRIHGAAVWDLFNVMGGLGSIAFWKREGLAQADLIHLTTKGYLLMGDLFFNAFIKKYEDYLKHPLSKIPHD